MQESEVENFPNRAVGKNKNYWQEIINQWEASNETQKVFCERLGITRGTFSYWRHIFSSKNKKKQNTFIPLKINKPTKNSQSKIVIKTPSGYKIILPQTIDNEILRSVFKMLGLNYA